MAKTRLSTTATYVERGYGQVEPNHLSAQRTGQIYAQLPADASIKELENGQFVKYDYANGVVTTSDSASGEWMLVYNEVKLYREGQSEADFAMIKSNYNARIYSPRIGDQGLTEQLTAARNYAGSTTANVWKKGDKISYTQPEDATSNGWTATAITVNHGVATPADPYEWDSTDTPFAAAYDYPGPKRMPADTRMVPRVFKTNVGDIFTTNTIAATTAAVGETFAPANGGYLTSTTATTGMLWEAVKLYDLADGQKAIKLMRIQ